MGVGVVAQLPQGARLMGLQLLAGPAVALAQRMSAAQYAQHDGDVDAPKPAPITGRDEAARGAGEQPLLAHRRPAASWIVWRRWRYASASISPRASRSANPRPSSRPPPATRPLASHVVHSATVDALGGYATGSRVPRSGGQPA